MGFLERIGGDDAPVVRFDLSDLTKLGIEVHETHLSNLDTVSDRDLLNTAHGLLSFSKRWQWYFYDVFMELSRRHGPEAVYQMFSGTDYSHGYLMNLVSIIGSVQKGNRFMDLSIRVYEAVRKIEDPVEQRKWLEMARPDEDEGRPAMTREELQEVMREEEHRIYAEENGRVVDHRPVEVWEDCTHCAGSGRIRVRRFQS